MNNYLSYSIIIILLVLLKLFYFRIADYFNIIDRPNERSSHTHITLRGGGIIFLLGIYLYTAFFGLNYPWFIIGLTAISAISFIDDIRSVPNTIRLIVQFSSMFLMLTEFQMLKLESWWIVIIACIICVGIINAFNFMDGINGLTGGYSLVVLASLIYTNLQNPFIDQNLLYIVGLSLLVFCFFNFRKRAKCFAGDVGAIGIAFILVFVLGKLIIKTQDFTYIIFLSIYGVDSVLTIIHRIMLKENLGVAHRNHAYQLMANELQIPHVVVSIIYMTMQLIVSFGLILLSINHLIYMVIVLIILCMAYVVFMKYSYHLHKAHRYIQ